MLLSSCYHISYHNFNDRPAEFWPHQTTAHILLYGWINLGPFNIKSYCPHGVNRIQSEVTLFDFLFSTFTAGFYSPRTVKFWCNKPLEKQDESE